MNFIEELKWRGMLHDSTPEIEAHLESKKCIGYIGFDPTAPSMTIGNYVQIMLLRLFQLSGHQPIVLMGGATGRIGDPSGKDKERELKSFDELDSNLNFQMEQVKKFLDFEGEHKAIIINNLDFYKDMNVLDFLRDVGKTLTVNYMSSKDSVKNRMDTGLSFTEFSYQLLQAYDFQCLFRDFNCSIQMGGSDQWGNITSGTEFIRRNLNQKAYAVTTPLLTKADGKKFGKSEQGNIWLDSKLTSPYKFYQFWINADDKDLLNFFKYFTLKSKAEFEEIWETNKDNPQQLKRILAEELTCRVHSKEAYESVLKVSELLFNKKATEESLHSMTAEEFDTVGGEISSFKIDSSAFEGGLNIIDLLTEHSTILSSKGEARKAIKNNAVAINKVKIADYEMLLNKDKLLLGKYMMVENGKKNKFLIIAK
jgi:tyrosyl-tRNA synthetase